MKRRAFTLMEVLLAMAIAVLIMGAITMAVDFHLRVLDSGRQEVEEAQLARALLRRIAEDLRSTVRYEKIDVESMLSQAASNSGAAGAAGALAGGGSSGSPGGGGQAPRSPLSPQSASGSQQQQQPGGSSSSGSTGTEESESISETAVVNPEPGLYGNLYELQIDLSRLPRIDQYERMLQTPDGRPTDAVSDVKTVAYYVPGTIGLIRRELDRAATSWAMNNGGIDDLALYEEVLAPEVAALEFRYFDGLEWFDEWDSTAARNLPLAVEIGLAIADPSVDRTAVTMMDLASLSGQPGYRVYRLLVHLPAAKSLAQQEAEAAAEAAKAAAEGTAGTSGSSTSSTGSAP